jgi:hypothetical protein
VAHQAATRATQENSGNRTALDSGGILPLPSNREIAIGFWLAAFLTFAFSQHGVRDASRELIKALLQQKILMVLGLALLYVAGVVAVLLAVGAWTIDLLKDTILWSLFSGIGVAFALDRWSQHENVFRKTIVENVKIVVMIEFITSTYTLSLPGELVLVPVLAVLAGMDAVASTDERYGPAGKLLKWLQGVIGSAIVMYAVGQAIADYQTLGSLATLRTVVLAPLLSILFSPFLYFLVLYTQYEALFLRLRVGANKSPDVQSYAKYRLLCLLGIRLQRVRDFLLTHGFDLMSVSSRSDVDKLINGAQTPPRAHARKAS